MASSRLTFLAISMIMFSSVAMAIDHIVGDDKGWTLDFNYTLWAQDKVFRVGDNLVFNYDNTEHNVFKVNGTFFKDCIIPPENEAFTSGKDIIQLATEGRKWYICGKADHCQLGQKLVITVLPPQGTWSPTPSPSPSPEVPWTASVPHFGQPKKLFKIFH